MEKKEINFKSTFLFIIKKNIIKYLLIVVVILIPIGKIINDKFFKKSNLSEETIITENNEPVVSGTINTDVEKDTENISRYNLDDGFSEVENLGSPNNSSTNIYPIVNEDKSSLNGRDITISEGDSFEAIRDLKLNATDKDGSNISNKINIESNDVNTEKPGVYSVKATVILSNGYKLQRVLTVSVKPVDLEVSVEVFKATKEQFEKNEKVTLELNIKSSKKHVKANTIMINGKEYPLYKGSTNIFSNIQKYKVNLDADGAVGKREYKLSYIKMSDNTLINVDETTLTEVLKAEGQVKNFTYEEQALAKRILAKFNLEDSDNSVSSLRMEVYKNKELIHTENLDKKENYEVFIKTYTNGVYNVKFIADININSEVTEENTIKNKEIFSETINISNINESSLTGKNVEILEGENFEPKVNLELKATDVNGEDITDKIVIDSNNVDVNRPGIYEVKVHVINKKNMKLEGSFIVTVKAKVRDNNVDSELEGFTFAEFNSNESRSGRALTRGVISGNDTETLDANVKVTGTVSKADGTAPGGKIQVEVPTRVSFTVDQKGNFSSGTLTIKNNSSSDVVVAVGSFTESIINGGITIKPLSEDLSQLDRSNINLYLVSDSTVDLGEKITTEKYLAEVQAANTKNIQLLGKVGKASGTNVDANGASEEFNLVFKIKKKN